MGMVAVSIREQWRTWQRERGLAESTIRVRDLLLRDLEDRGVALEAATLEDLRALLGARRLGPRGRYTLISHLACFYRWALSEGIVDRDPTCRLARPKLPRRMPRPIPETDYALALTVCADPVMRAMLLLAGMAGLRCCEIARLAWTDVDLSEAVIRVVGKNNRERFVPLHPAVVEHLVDMPRSSPWVAASSTGAQRSATMISIVMNAFLRHVVGTTATAHQLRHRAATRAYVGSLDLISVQRMLGHSSVSTTQIYADVLDGAVRAVVESVELPHVSGNAGNAGDASNARS